MGTSKVTENYKKLRPRHAKTKHSVWPQNPPESMPEACQKRCKKWSKNQSPNQCTKSRFCTKNCPKWPPKIDWSNLPFAPSLVPFSNMAPRCPLEVPDLQNHWKVKKKNIKKSNDLLWYLGAFTEADPLRRRKWPSSANTIFTDAKPMFAIA